MSSDLEKRLKATVQAEYDDQQIKCPACGYTWADDSLAQYISDHGEDGPKNSECPACQTLLTIEECVTRTFDVTIARAEGETH